MADMNNFFHGGVKDNSTKESRKAAQALAVLRTIQKNPDWKPVDNTSKKIKNMTADQVAKLVPLLPASSSSTSTPSTSSSPAPQPSLPERKGNFKNLVLAEVEADIHRRIHALGKTGQMFEQGAAYATDSQLAADAPYLVRGMDPQAARSSDAFARSRKIHVQKKHWVAYKQGYVLTPYGMAYIHTDGSIAMLQHGKPQQCPCGALHMP